MIPANQAAVLIPGGNRFSDIWYRFFANPYQWQNWTPVLGAGAGVITSYTVNRGRFIRVAKLVIAHFDYTIGVNGTGATFLTTSLPVAPVGNEPVYGLGPVGALTGNLLVGGGANLVNYDNTYPGADGAHILGTAIYEVQ